MLRLQGEAAARDKMVTLVSFCALPPDSHVYIVRTGSAGILLKFDLLRSVVRGTELTVAFAIPVWGKCLIIRKI